MSKADEPAFPQQRVWSPGDGQLYIEPGGAVKTETIGGLTKREYFAGLALVGTLFRVPSDVRAPADTIAQDAVALADALLSELQKGGGGV